MPRKPQEVAAAHRSATTLQESAAVAADAKNAKTVKTTDLKQKHREKSARAVCIWS